MNGSIGSVTVSTSGTLGGNGTVGAISLNGGDLSPGNSAGTLSAASLEWNTGGIVFDLGGDAQTSDLLALSGSLTGSDGPKLFTFLNNGWVIGNTYDLIGFGSTSLSIGQFGFTNMEGFEGNFAYNANVLQFTVVPEPGIWALLIVVCLAIAFRRCWRRA